MDVEVEEAVVNNRRVWGVRLARLARLRDRLGPRYRPTDRDMELVGGIVTAETVEGEIEIAMRELRRSLREDR